MKDWRLREGVFSIFLTVLAGSHAVLFAAFGAMAGCFGMAALSSLFAYMAADHLLIAFSSDEEI